MISVGDSSLCQSPFMTNYWMKLEMSQRNEKSQARIPCPVSVLEINEV